MISHHFECFRKCDCLDVVPDSPNELLNYFANFTATDSPDACGSLSGGRIASRVIISPRNESHFQINLRKFWLPVLPAILITEAFSDLEVSIYASRAN